MGLKKVNPSASPPAPPIHTSTENLRSINDTWYWRFLTLAAIKLLGSIRPRQGMILFITRTLCVKYGPLRHLPEASTIEFIACNTSIPVPKIYCAFTHNGWTYLYYDAKTWRRMPCVQLEIEVGGVLGQDPTAVEGNDRWYAPDCTTLSGRCKH